MMLFSPFMLSKNKNGVLRSKVGVPANIVVKMSNEKCLCAGIISKDNVSNRNNL